MKTCLVVVYLTHGRTVLFRNEENRRPNAAYVYSVAICTKIPPLQEDKSTSIESEQNILDEQKALPLDDALNIAFNLSFVLLFTPLFSHLSICSPRQQQKCYNDE